VYMTALDLALGLVLAELAPDELSVIRGVEM
jgi:hypothetical protein